MKVYQFTFLVIFLLLPKKSFCQEMLFKDLDGDKTNDTINYERKKSYITCKLSSQSFKEIKTQKIEFINSGSSGIKLTKNGFQFYNYQMREGYTCQFRYNKRAEKIQLIGMERYNDGGANHDGSGESSVNLLTNTYIGNWNYFNSNNKKLVKIPTIKEKYVFPKSYFENFSNKQPEKYREDCDKFYLKYKK
jgi:hypothetical protein